MSCTHLVFRALATVLVAHPFLLAQVLMERPAAAQDISKVDKKERANQYVKEGLTAQQKGEYVAAIALYGKAYELVPHPVLLFNMAQAHRLAGNTELARDLYRQYLNLEPHGATARTAREFLVALDAQIDATRGSAIVSKPIEPVEPIKPTEPAEPRKLTAPISPVAPTVLVNPALLEPISAPAKDGPELRASMPSRGHSLRLAGLITGGVGVASVGVGVAFHMRALSLSHELSEPGVTFDSNKERSGETAEQVMNVAYVAGGALLIGGATLYLWGHRAGAARVALSPTFSQDVSGFVVSGRMQ